MAAVSKRDTDAKKDALAQTRRIMARLVSMPHKPHKAPKKRRSYGNKTPKE